MTYSRRRMSSGRKSRVPLGGFVVNRLINYTFRVSSEPRAGRLPDIRRRVRTAGETLILGLCPRRLASLLERAREIEADVVGLGTQRQRTVEFARGLACGAARENDRAERGVRVG